MTIYSDDHIFGFENSLRPRVRRRRTFWEIIPKRSNFPYKNDSFLWLSRKLFFSMTIYSDDHIFVFGENIGPDDHIFGNIWSSPPVLQWIGSTQMLGNAKSMFSGHTAYIFGARWMSWTHPTPSEWPEWTPCCTMTHTITVARAQKKPPFSLVFGPLKKTVAIYI